MAQSKMAWKEVALQPPSAFRQACLSGGSSTQGTGGAPTAAADHHHCWTNAGTYVRVCVCLCLCGLRRCADLTTQSPSDLAVFGWLAGGMRGRGTCTAVSIIPLGSCSGVDLAGRTAAAAGSGWT